MVPLRCWAMGLAMGRGKLGYRATDARDALPKRNEMTPWPSALDKPPIVL